MRRSRQKKRVEGGEGLRFKQSSKGELAMVWVEIVSIDCRAKATADLLCVALALVPRKANADQRMGSIVPYVAKVGTCKKVTT